MRCHLPLDLNSRLTTVISILASLNTLAKYKQDNESLRNELTNLLDSSPELSSSLLLSEEIAALQTTTDALTQHKLRLEEQVRDLRTRLEEGDKMRRDAEKKERKKVEDERETIVKARVAETHSALKSAQKDRACHHFTRFERCHRRLNDDYGRLN